MRNSKGYVLAAFAVTLLWGCAASLEEKSFELKLLEKEISAMDFNQLVAEIFSLNAYIGSYPPDFADEQERELIYSKWLSLASEAEAYRQENAGAEKAFYLLAEVYRQGHNMGVIGSAERAHENLDLCLASYPKSMFCNFSAVYFYLSIANHLDQAERSLSVLKRIFVPDRNDEVEAGYVFLYLYQGNAPLAKQQIDFFLRNFPGSRWAGLFTDIRADLDKTIGRGERYPYSPGVM